MYLYMHGTQVYFVYVCKYMCAYMCICVYRYTHTSGDAKILRAFVVLTTD